MRQALGCGTSIHDDDDFEICGPERRSKSTRAEILRANEWPWVRVVT